MTGGIDSPNDAVCACRKGVEKCVIEDFDLQQITAPLLSWFSENARKLPWREEVSPYRVWVSEIMLQQTRVEAVKPYFARFLDALPTVRDLAECDEDVL